MDTTALTELPAPLQGLKTIPFDHQADYLVKYAYEEAHGLWWEQGTGKTKALIDNAAVLWRAGKIVAVIVVAPSGVDRNWRSTELPAHLPEDMERAGRIMLWRQPKHQTVAHRQEFAALLAHDGPVWLIIKYQSLMTKAGKEAVWKVLQKAGARVRGMVPGAALMICDESAHDNAIKTPSSATALSVKNAGRYASYRRCADGTPVAESPVDSYSQIRFLRPNHWRMFQLSPFIVFKTHFGVWRPGTEVYRTEKNRRTGKAETKLVQYMEAPLSYRNLEELQEHILGTGSRVEKDDVLDLPPKLYQKHWFELTKRQRQLYEQLKEEFYVEMASGGTVEANLSIVRLLRLQQISCGYLPSGEEGQIELIEGGNPRLDACEELLPKLRRKTIWWCRFLQDADLLMRLLASRRPVRYDGTRTDDQCEQAKLDFQEGDATDFVSTLSKGHAGLTLHAAETCVYYSNSFRARHRLQSEDRPHRAGLKHSVNYIDLLAEDTVDEKMVAALRAKYDIATQLTGSKLKEWL